MGCCASSPGADDDFDAPYAGSGGYQIRTSATAGKDLWGKTGVVSLRGRQLSRVPSDEIGKVAERVRVLDVSENKLKELPEELLGKLVGCRQLSASSCRLETIPAAPLREPLGRTLRQLNLDGNRLTALPDELGFMVKLEQLIVCRNALQSLPEGLTALPALVLLDVSGNQLNTLPDGPWTCPRLQEVDARDNCIMSVPLGMGSAHGCPLLKTLRLDGNGITASAIPDGLLAGLPRLSTLTLHGNPVTVEELLEVPGYEDLEKRRQAHYTKQISSNVEGMGRGLDSGASHGIDTYHRSP